MEAATKSGALFAKHAYATFNDTRKIVQYPHSKGESPKRDMSIEWNGWPDERITTM